MALAPSLRKIASRLTLKFGTPVTYRRVTPGIYNTTAGTETENTVDTTVRVVLQDITQREVTDLIRATDKRAIMAAPDLSVAPTAADRLIVSSVEHQIISVNTVEQDGLPITYELILRS